MTKEVQMYNFEGNEIRTVIQKGEPWFVAKDIATALGYERAADAIRAHVDEEDKLTRRFTDSGQGRDMTVINESGMYALIFSSQLPSAKKFKRWVTSEVLPDIRKHGMYLSDKAMSLYEDNLEAFQHLLDKYREEHSKNVKLRKEIDDNRAFTILGQMVVAIGGSMTLKDASNLFAQHGIHIGQNRMFARGRKDKFLCARKGKQWNKPTQKAIENGYFNLEISGKNNTITMITPKGLKHYSEVLTQEEYPILSELDKQAETEE